jgi:hypothetical protein
VNKNVLPLLCLLLSACASARLPDDPCAPLRNDPESGRGSISGQSMGAVPPPAHRSELAKARDCEREHAPVAPPTSDQRV